MKEQFKRRTNWKEEVIKIKVNSVHGPLQEEDSSNIYMSLNGIILTASVCYWFAVDHKFLLFLYV